MVAGRAGFLLDTNVISELMKTRPNRQVAAWVDATPEELLHLSVITIGEVRKGIELLGDDDPRRGALQSWLNRDLRVRFAGRLLVFDDAVAERWGHVEALAKTAEAHRATRRRARVTPESLRVRSWVLASFPSARSRTRRRAWRSGSSSHRREGTTAPVRYCLK